MKTVISTYIGLVAWHGQSCVITQALHLEDATLGLMACLAILKLILFKESVLHFHFMPGPENFETHPDIRWQIKVSLPQSGFPGGHRCMGV